MQQRSTRGGQGGPGHALPTVIFSYATRDGSSRIMNRVAGRVVPRRVARGATFFGRRRLAFRHLVQAGREPCRVGYWMGETLSSRRI